MWLSGGRASHTEQTACAEALGWECAWCVPVLEVCVMLVLSGPAWIRHRTTI